MIRLDLTAGGMALAAVLVLPGVALAGPGVVVYDEETETIECQALATCSDGTCDSDLYPSCLELPGTGTSYCTSADGYSTQVLCCTGTDTECCASATGVCTTAGEGCRLGFPEFHDTTGEPAYLCKGFERCSIGDTPRETLKNCVSYESAEGVVATDLPKGDCDRDGVRNVSDCCTCGCPCEDASCTPEHGGCAADGGVDAGMTRPDGGPTTGRDGGPSDDAGAPNEDGGPGGFDAGDTGEAGFAGDGGCRTIPGAPAGPLASALILLAVLGLRRRP